MWRSGERKRGEDYLSITKLVVRFDQMDAAQFMITRRIQPGADQVSLVGEEQDGITVESQMDRPAIAQGGHLFGFPDLLAGARFQTDQAAAYFAGEHVLAQDHRHARVAQDPERQGFRLRPEHRRGRLVAVELEHQSADQ